MKTTRRSLLRVIGMGAAAAALVPTQTEAAAEPLTPCGHIAAECCDACWGTGEATISATRSYANGRADGYNRGREVEAAAQESRLDRERQLIERFTSMPLAVDPGLRGLVTGEMGHAIRSSFG